MVAAVYAEAAVTGFLVSARVDKPAPAPPTIVAEAEGPIDAAI